MTDVHTPPTWSNDLDQVRATVQALQGAATLLQGAMEQREALSTEMRTAEERLSSLEERRAQAEQALASATAQLARASQDLERTRSEQSGVLSEFDRLVQGALSRRGALLAEISELENRRDTLAPAPAPPLRPISHVIAHTGPLAAHVAPEPEPQAPEPAPESPEAAEKPEDPDEPAGPLAPVIALPVARHTQRLRLPGLRSVVTLLLSTVLVGMAVLVTPVTELAGGLQLLSVMSGSMEPTIQVGGIVGVLPTAASGLHVGDVITFANQSAPDVLVTHRIVDIEERGGQELLTTRGDANDSADAVSVPATHAVGRVWFTLPWLGYAMFWLASPLAKLGIVAVTAIGFALTSIKRPAARAADAPKDDTYSDLESEIAALLPKAS